MPVRQALGHRSRQGRARRRTASKGGGTPRPRPRAHRRAASRYGSATSTAFTSTPSLRSQTANSPRDHSMPVIGALASSAPHSAMRPSAVPVVHTNSAIAAATGNMRIGSPNRHASCHASLRESAPRTVPAQRNQRTNKRGPRPGQRRARPVQDTVGVGRRVVPLTHHQLQSRARAHLPHTTDR